MTSRRLSTRTLSVNKRKLLEVKLKERRVKADLKLQKARSKALKDLQNKELQVFTKEAFRLSDIVDRFELSENLVDADVVSQESLEWDHLDEDPSFLTATSKSSVDEIIEEIFSSSPTEANLQDQVNLQSRRKTSTDPDFLEDPGPVVSDRGENPRLPFLDWPPRIPSAEPDVLSPPVFSSTLHFDLPAVFESETPVAGTKMEEGTFKTRLKAITVAEMKVRQEIKKFLAKDLTIVHLTEHQERRKYIRDKYDSFDNLVIELICDLDSSDATDQPRIAALKQQQDVLLQEVIQNEKEVSDKIIELQTAQPTSQAEKDALEEKKAAKAEKAQKVAVDMEDVSARCKSLLDSLNTIQLAPKLSDHEVRQHLLDSKTWSSKCDDIVSSKVKVDKDIIGLEVDKEVVSKLNAAVEKVKTAVSVKITELKEADKIRGLYSLSKAVKDLAVYPPPFSGKDNEDIFKFKEKMMDAITSNQVREKDKVEVLRKYLQGDAKQFIGENFDSIDKAFEALLEHYGLARRTWDCKLRDFLKLVDKPQVWTSVGSRERLRLLTKFQEFIREAEKLASDHPDMKSTIISHETVAKFIKVVPIELTAKAQELGDGPKTKDDKRFQNFKIVLEKELSYAVELSQFKESVQANTSSFNAVKSGYDRFRGKAGKELKSNSKKDP